MVIVHAACEGDDSLNTHIKFFLKKTKKKTSLTFLSLPVLFLFAHAAGMI